MTRLKRALSAGAPPLLAGALAAAGQAPLGAWWLTLPALWFVIRRLSRITTMKPRLWQGWCAGTGYFAAALFWIVEPFMVDAAHDGWMAPFALLFMAVGMALFWLIGPALAGLGRSVGARAGLIAAGLAAGDLIRSYIFTGFPWALFGHVWIGTPVAQAAAFVGPIGLTVLTLLLALFAVLWRARGLGLSAVLLAALWGGGLMRLATPEIPRDPPIRVRLVQPNATQSLKWDPKMWNVFLDRQLNATAAPSARPLNLIVWPETAVPWSLDRAGATFEEIAATSNGVPVALGIQRDEGMAYYNSFVVLDAAGAVTQLYDKYHLVPFGEYIPMGDALARFGITAFAAREGAGYTAGAGARVLNLGRAGRILPLICYEAIFPQDLRAAPERADWVLQVTNDSWFGNLAGPWQHLAQTRLRAIETGLPLLRDANTGITAAMDAHGRVLASLPLNTDGFLDIDVPAALPQTLYARTGDLPATILILLWILAIPPVARRKSD